MRSGPEYAVFSCLTVPISVENDQRGQPRNTAALLLVGEQILTGADEGDELEITIQRQTGYLISLPRCKRVKVASLTRADQWQKCLFSPVEKTSDDRTICIWALGGILHNYVRVLLLLEERQLWRVHR